MQFGPACWPRVAPWHRQHGVQQRPLSLGRYKASQGQSAQFMVHWASTHHFLRSLEHLCFFIAGLNMLIDLTALSFHSTMTIKINIMTIMTIINIITSFIHSESKFNDSDVFHRWPFPRSSSVWTSVPWKRWFCIGDTALFFGDANQMKVWGYPKWMLNGHSYKNGWFGNCGLNLFFSNPVNQIFFK